MTDKKRIENIVNISDTLWQLNRFDVIAGLEKLNRGQKIPEDCMTLIEYAFRYGAVFMEKALGRGRTENVQM